MCDLKQPKPKSGPTLCHAGQETVVRCVLLGNSNDDIRRVLQKEKHYHDLSDQAFTHYRKLPIVKEARVMALTNMRDVGVVMLARRIERLNDMTEQLFAKTMATSDNTERATLARAAIAACKELSRLVDVIDPDGSDGIPNAGETASAPVSIGQVLAAFEALTIRKRNGEFVPDVTAEAEEADAQVAGQA